MLICCGDMTDVHKKVVR